jgi:hypothetical protein
MGQFDAKINQRQIGLLIGTLISEEV